MRASLAFKIFGLAAITLAQVVSASPLRDPKRLVNDRTIDLQPLFQWWTKHNGSRPLTAWVHVSGSIVGTNSVGWVLEAQVEGGVHAESGDAAKESAPNKPDKIILRNPPRSDQAEFERLSTQLKNLSAERTQVAAAETQAKDRAQADAKAQGANRRNRSYSRALAAQEKQLKQTETQAKDQLKVLDQQIADIKKKLSVYPSNDHYAVDCFALDTGTVSGRIPVYDHGQVFK